MIQENLTQVKVSLLTNGTIQVGPWVAPIPRSQGIIGIKWEGVGCRIKIELEYPGHFPGLPPVYAPTVIGILAAGVPEGTYPYCISVLGPDQKRDDQLVAEAYTIDPDYKVDR